MYKKILSLAFLIPVFFLQSCMSTVDEKQSEVYKGVYDVALPAFPDLEVKITDFGASPDMEALNTLAINEAIQFCNAEGGGRVVIPGGVWLTGPIRLLSNVDLHVEAGAIVLFSPDFDQYPYIKTWFEGQRDYRAMPMLFGDSLENIAITGEGIFDGSGDAWRQVKKGKTTDRQWSELLASGGSLNDRGDTWWPNSYAYEVSEDPDGFRKVIGEMPDRDKYKAFYRPPLVQLISCDRVLLEGPAFQNSPGWCIHPLMCTNLTVNNIRVKNPWYAQNGDGIDVESCSYVSIRNSHFDVGDDAICIKSGKNEEGRKRGIPTQYVEVDNCVVYHGHGGFVVGSEMSGGVKDIRVSNCSFLGTDVGLRFKSTRGRGGVVENIHIENIRMINIARDAIIFNLFYANQSPVNMTESPADYLRTNVPEVSEETPEFRGITITGINCQGAERALQVTGLPEMPVSGLSLTSSIFSTRKGINCLFAKNLEFADLEIYTDDEPALILTDVTDASIASVKGNDPNFLIVAGAASGGIRVQETADDIREGIHLGDKVETEAVQIVN